MPIIIQKEPEKRRQLRLHLTGDDVEALVRLFDAIGQGKCPRISQDLARTILKCRKAQRRFGSP